VFMAAGPAIDFLTAMWRGLRAGTIRWKGVAARAGAGNAVFALCFLPQLLSYLALFGRAAPSSTVQGKLTWTSPHTWSVLASPSNGLLFWTPLALPALAGLIWLAVRREPFDAAATISARERRHIGLICLVMVMTQIYVGGALDTWAGAGSFGQRRLVGLTVFFVLGLAVFFVALRNRWAAYGAYVFAALAVWWNLGLTAQFGAGLMNRQRLEPARNAYHTFVTIPRSLPALTYRFLLDRPSFYQRQPPP
jgi:hypothetical protein